MQRAMMLVASAMVSACTGEMSGGGSTSRVQVSAVHASGAVDVRPEARLVGAWGAVTVDAEGALRLRDEGGERRLDSAALPELAVSPDAAWIAWPHRTELGAELVVYRRRDGSQRAVKAGLQVADRPVFSPDGSAVYFWGSGAGDALVGLYRASLVDLRPVRLLNVGVTRVSDPRFVAPPMDATSSRFTAEGALTYATPDGVTTLSPERLQ